MSVKDSRNQSAGSARRQTHRRHRTAALSRFENLEDRYLLTVEFLTPDTLLASGSSSDDTFSIRAIADDSDRFEIVLNGVREHEGPRAEITGGLQVSGLAGNDTLVVDYSNGDPVPPGGIFFQGGIPFGGSDVGDRIDVRPTSALSVSFQARPDNSDAGLFLVEDSAAISFDGVERVELGGETFLLPDAHEPNQSFATAVVLGSDPSTTLRDLTIHDLGRDNADIDFYRVTASQTGMLIVNALFEHAKGDVTLAIHDDQGFVIASSLSTTNNERITIPSVAQESYYVQVRGERGVANRYALEVENFAAPVPQGVHLATASDTGVMNNDGITISATPRILVHADLNEFLVEGIPVLSGDEASAGESAGAAVFVSGTHTLTGVVVSGFATLIPDNELVFEFRAPALPDGSYLFASAVQVFDPRLTIGSTLEEFAQPAPASGRTNFSHSVEVQIDSTRPDVTSPQLLPSSDSGMSQVDMVTNIIEPAFVGVTDPNTKVRVFANGLLVGEGQTGSDGRWEVTVEPLVDGIYDVINHAEDTAGNVSENSTIERIEIDTIAPNTPFLDLVAASDTGIDTVDNITGDTTLSFTMTTSDANAGDHLNPFNLKYRLYVRPEGGVEELVYNSADSLPAGDLNGGFTNLNGIVAELPELPEGVHNFKLEVEDRAGNISHDFLLNVEVDLGLEGDASFTLLNASDSGMDVEDGVTRISQPTFTGISEVGAQVYIFANDELVGTTIVGTDNLSPGDGLGTWSVTTSPLRDGVYIIDTQIEDPAGNRELALPQQIEVDTEAPNTPHLDLVSSSDTGASGADNVTEQSDLVFNMTTTDPGEPHQNEFNFKYRLYLRPEAGPESLVYDSSVDDAIQAANRDAFGFTNLGQLQATVSGLPLGTHNFKLEVEDRAGNISTDAILDVTIAEGGVVVGGDTTISLVPPSDSGMSSTDNVTNISGPTFSGTGPIEGRILLRANGALVGVGIAGSDASDGVLGDGLGLWAITTESLSDGIYEVTATHDGGNSSEAIIIEVDTIAPNTPALDLITASDTGTSTSDNVTGDNTPTFTMTTSDANSDAHASAFNLKYRLYLRGEGQAEELIFDSAVDLPEGSLQDGLTDLTLITADLPSLPDGIHNLKLEVEDRAGNISTDFLLEVQIDSTLPRAVLWGLPPESDSGMSNVDNVTNFSRPTLDGIAEAGATISVFSGTRLVGMTQVGSDITDGVLGDGQGAFQLTTSALHDGVHILTATVEDDAGNLREAEPLTLEVDTLAPNTPALDLLPESDTGQSSSDNITRLNELSFNFATEDPNQSSHITPLNYKYRLFARYDSGEEELVYDSVGDDAISADATDGVFTSLEQLQRTISQLPAGVHNFKLEVEDRAGNISTDFLLNVEVDLGLLDTVSFSLLSASDTGMDDADGVTRISQPTFTGISEVGSQVFVFANSELVGTAIVGTDNLSPGDGLGTWTVTTSPLTDGIYVIDTQIEDTAGNRERALPALIEVDTLAPNQPHLDLVASSDSGTSGTDNVTGRDDLTFVMTTTDPGQADHQDQFNYKYRLYVRPEGGSEVLLYDSSVDEGLFDSTDIFGFTNLEAIQTTLSDLPAGTHNFKLEVEDRAGNISIDAILDVTIDPSIAGATTISLLPSSDAGMSASDNVTRIARPTFAGLGEAGGVVRLQANGLVVGTGTVGSDASDGVEGDGLGLWSVTSETLADGVYNLAATVEDAVGNTSESDMVTVEIDTLQPNVPFLDLVTSSDSGHSSTDNITGTATPTFSMAVVDRNVANHINTFNYKYRLFARTDAGEELIYDSVGDATLAEEATDGVFTSLSQMQRTLESALSDGTHNFKLEVEDRAGNISDAFLLDVTVDTSLLAPSTGLALDLVRISDSGMSDEDNVTKINTPAFAGIAEVGAEVSLFADGFLVGTATVGSDETDLFAGNGLGVWQITSQALTDGTHEIVAHLEDWAGNFEQTQPLTIDVDTEAPNTPFLDLVGGVSQDLGTEVTSSTTLSLSMTTSDPAIEQRLDPFNFKYRLFLRSSGQPEQLIYESATDDTFADNLVDGFTDLPLLETTLQDLPAGTHNFKLEVEDRAGNISHDFLLEVQIVQSSAGPVDAQTIALLASSDTGMDSTDNVTRMNQPALNGIATVGAEVRLIANDTIIGTATVGGDASNGVLGDDLGKWEITSKPLRDDVYTVFAEIEGSSGNVATTDPLTFEVDTHAPNTPLLDVQSSGDSGISDADNVTNQQQLLVTMATLDPNAAQHLSSFNYKFRLFARDADGERLVYDSAADDSLTEKEGGFTQLANLQRVIDLGLQDGVQNLKLEVEDRAGNISQDVILNVTLDRSLQTRMDGVLTAGLLISSDTGMSERDGVTLKDQPVFSGVAEVGAMVSIFANGSLIGTGTVGSDNTDFVPGDGLGVWEIATDRLDDGVYTVLTHAEDVAGNFLRSEPVTIEVDTIAPNTPYLDLLNDTGHTANDNITGESSLTLSMTTEDTVPPGGHVSPFNLKYRVYARPEGGEEALVYNSVTDASILAENLSEGFTDLRQLTANLDALPDGTHNLKLEVEDRAGNISRDFLLNVQIDSAIDVATTIDLLTSNDTGMNASDNVTSQNELALSGVGEVESIVRLFAGDELIGVGEVGSDASDGILDNGVGRWEITTKPLRDGVYPIIAEIEDWAGNLTRTDAIEVEVDTIAPNTPLLDLVSTSDTGISDTDSITLDGNATFNMTTTDSNAAAHLFADNHKYRLYVRGESGSEALVYDSSTDSIAGLDGFVSLESLQRDLAVDLEDGTYNFKLEVEDRAGNISDDFLLNVTLDRTLDTPTGVVTIDLLADSDSGMSDRDDVTNKDRPTFSGIAEVGAVVNVFANGQLVGSTVVGSDQTDFIDENGLGTWQVAVEPLADGVYSFVAHIEDAAGNSMFATPLNVEIDTRVPNTPFLDLMNDAGHSRHDNITNQNALVVNMTTEDPLPAGGRLNDFNLKYRIFVRPEGGAESLIFNSVVDAAVPQEFLLEGFTSLSQIQATLSELPDGIHNLKLEVEDRAGNISEDFLMTVEIDTSIVDGTLAMMSASDTGMLDDDHVTNKDRPAFFGVGEVGSTVRLLANGEFVGVAEIQSDLSDGELGNGLGRWEVTSQPLRDGTYTITAEVEDWAGNLTQPAPLAIEVDTLAPNTPLLDLVVSSDSGSVARDEVTNDRSLTFNMTSTDPNQADHIAPHNYKFRLYARAENAAEVLIFDSATDPLLDSANLVDGLTNLEFLQRTLIDLPDGTHNFKLEVEDRAGNISEDFLLSVHIDTVLSVPEIDLITSSDTGMSETDRVTNKDQPAVAGTGDIGDRVSLFANDILVGTAVVGGDETDGIIGNGRGAWEITSEPLKDGVYSISAHLEDQAGNTQRTTPFAIEVDTLAPNTPQLDLLEADDSGRHNDDNVTNAAVLRFTATTEDPNRTFHASLFPDGQNLKYRLFVRPESGQETLVYESALDGNIDDLLDGLTANELVNIPGIALPEGLHNLKLEVEDRAGNISHDFLMDVLVDRTPFRGTITVGAGNDTGIWGIESTLNDGITSASSPTLVGTAEANSLVTVSIDGVAIGTAVALPFDGDDAVQPPNPEYSNLAGNWQLSQGISLGDGQREVTVTFEDLAGNRETAMTDAENFTFLVDTVGPRIENVTRSDAAFTSMFDLKPDGGPDPLIDSIVIHFSDGPDRTAAVPYSAVLAELALEEGNYQLVGDANGNIPIVNVSILDEGQGPGIARSAIELTFAAPLPDDRFTLLVSDRISDRAGNPLDGESGALAPFVGNDSLIPTPPIFSTGDGNHGAAFNARFTVDSRPEIGAWAAGSIWIDTNGNFIFDQDNKDFVNRDITYNLGFTSDDVFAGNFTDGTVADGFDKLAVYGRRGGWVDGTFRWLIDTDNDGVADINVEDPADVNGLPLSGRFDNNDANGDEVAVFTGDTWHFDTDHDFRVDTQLRTNMRGYPIVGDFDGDGFDDLATWSDDRFQVDLADGIRNGWDGVADTSFRYGFIGVRERPVAADMDQDGIDDIGLWTPDREGIMQRNASEWYWLVSGGQSILNRVNESFDPVLGQTQEVDFTPIPFGNDIFAQFGDEFALPVVGNFDPPSVNRGTINSIDLPPNFTNPNNPLDINNDGAVTPRDALLIINQLNQHGAGSLDQLPNDADYFDATDDGYVSARDALAVVNGLNALFMADQIADPIDNIADDVASALDGKRR